MATTLLYPTSVELSQIEQKKLPLLTMNDPLFKIFPIKSVNAHLVEWDQRDNFTGLMAVRGLDGRPPRVSAKGANRFSMEPGVYGEHMTVSEREITTRAGYGANAMAPIDVTDLVMERSEQLLTREIARMCKTGWDLLTLGRFSIAAENGSILHTDSYRQTVYRPSVAWTTPATSTPLADFRAVKLLARGTSSSFGASSVAYMNQVTANYVLSNTNANDLAGKRTSGLSTVLSIADYNKIATGEDLPTIEIYDEGYQDDTDTFVPYIATGYVQVVGKRQSGAPVGRWTMTRNANNPGYAPGPYYKLVAGEKPGEPPLEVHRGFNGGIELHYPGSLVTMVVN